MAQQTVTQPKKTPKHLYRKSIESTNTHTCAESDHRISPNVKCENKSRTTCSRFHRLHSESNLACGGRLLGQHVRNALPTARQPSRVGEDSGAARSSRAAHSPALTKKKKTHSLTLLLQNHLDHLNILLQALARSRCAQPCCHHGKNVHVHPCCRLSPVTCTSVADDLTSNNLHDFFHEP